MKLLLVALLLSASSKGSTIISGINRMETTWFYQYSVPSEHLGYAISSLILNLADPDSVLNLESNGNYTLESGGDWLKFKDISIIGDVFHFSFISEYSPQLGLIIVDAGNLSYTESIYAPGNMVPEPSSSLLVALGAVACLNRRRL